MSDSSDPAQIATWIRADSSRPYCTRPWNQAAVLSDGTVVCACIDAEKSNPLGNLKLQPFEEIWNGARYEALRKSIATDIDEVPICRGCPNRTAGPPPPEEPRTQVPLPRALFIESYAGCNLFCPGCNREGIEGSRTDLTLDFQTYQRLIDAVSPGLAYMEFHLGGENYMHKDASRMVRYCRDQNPASIILTSTNGHFFHTQERCQDVLDSGLDCIIFSVDGATQESYERYRKNGRLDRVFDGMRRLVEMRRAKGGASPLLVWRYILFSWNDSDEEMDLARTLCRDMGLDHLTWHLNAVDGQNESPRYHVGSPALREIEHELWDTLVDRLGVEMGVDFSRYGSPG